VVVSVAAAGTEPHLWMGQVVVVEVEVGVVGVRAAAD